LKLSRMLSKLRADAFEVIAHAFRAATAWSGLLRSSAVTKGKK
jgi:hypothetical protein